MSEEKEFKEASVGDVFKFEKDGDTIEGELMSFKPSTMYPDSFAIKLETANGLVTTFVSKIVTDLISSNGIKEGDTIRIQFTGMQKNKDGSKEYKNYKVFWK